MPLEVRQIGIRLSVGESGSGQPDDRPAAADGGERREMDSSERAAIVEECVDAVLTAIRMQSER